MVLVVSASARIAAGLFLALGVIALSAPAHAQPKVNVKVSGPGNAGAHVDVRRIGGGRVELTAGKDGSATATGTAPTILGGPLPLEPGIYEIWVESGTKDAGGNYISGGTFVYVGKDGTTNVDFDLTGLPPADPSGARVFRIGLNAKQACNMVTYQRAVNQLTAYVADLDRGMAALRGAIEQWLRDGAMDAVPEPYRTDAGGMILTGRTPGEITQSLRALSAKHHKADPNSFNTPLDALARAYDKLAALAAERAEYVDYLTKLQPPPDCNKRVSMYQDSLRPINVGAKGTVGCDAKLKQEVAGALGGGGGLGGLGGGSRSFGLGGGGGGGFGGLGGSSGRNNPASRSNAATSEPKLSPDPVPADMKRNYAMGGTELAFGTQFTDKGLWVSANILKAPCQGTFQTVYLQDPQTGEKAGPTGYVLTELYSDWKLTVSWTYDRYVNNQHVEHREGGWKEGGRELVGSWRVPSDGKGVWNDLGWGTAVAGAKGMGFFFPVTYADFAKKPLDIVVHVTNPDTNPVGTTGFGFETAGAMREAGEFGRAGKDRANVPSQKSPGEMTWKTPYSAGFRYAPPPPPPPPP